MDPKNTAGTPQKTRKRGGQHLILFASVLIGAACGFLLMAYMDSISADSLPLGSFLLLLCLLLAELYIAMLLQTVLHEAGHLVFGLLTGYRFLSFRVGHLMWVKVDGSLTFRRMSLAGTAGQCLMSPPDIVDGKMPFVLYHLGGAMMNLITAPVFGAACFLSRDIPCLPPFFLMASVVGVGFALLNGIPGRLGPVDNDGYNASALAKSAAARASFWVQLKVTEQLARGLRLKDMPKEWFYLPDEAGLQNCMTAVMAVFYENLCMDTHRLEEAEGLIDQLLSADTALTGLHSSLLACDRLYCALIRDENSEVIARLRSKALVKFMRQMGRFPAVLRTEYAYALRYEKDPSKAARVRAQFEQCAKMHPYPGDTESERELLDLAGETV